MHGQHLAPASQHAVRNGDCLLEICVLVVKAGHDHCARQVQCFALIPERARGGIDAAKGRHDEHCSISGPESGADLP